VKKFCIFNICRYFHVTDDSEGTVIHRTDALAPMDMDTLSENV